MKTVYDKNGNQVKLVEQSDNDFNTIVGNGVSIMYNEYIVTIIFNASIDKINGGNVLNDDIISLPNGITTKRELWHTFVLLSSSWIPISSNNAYFSMSANTSKINIRTTTSVENVVMVGVYTYPRQLFNIS